MEILERLDRIQKNAEKEIAEARSFDSLEKLRVKYLGRKSEITSVLKGLKDLPQEMKPRVGKASNRVKGRIEEVLARRREQISDEIFNTLGEREKVDITEPGIRTRSGHLHP
ncbi:MAG: phenylalanine--tRNA ligase subunit alpha, partial [Spirochaetota bacterium]